MKTNKKYWKGIGQLEGDPNIEKLAHNEFKELSLEQIIALGKQNYILYDVKYLLKAEEVDGRL